MITASLVKQLREETGLGMEQCKRILEICEGNFKLAKCYARYDGCAVYVKGNYQEWVMKMALGCLAEID